MAKLQKFAKASLVQKIGEYGLAGLVDHFDKRMFDYQYRRMKTHFSAEFVALLETFRRRSQPLVETIKKCMLPPIRTIQEELSTACGYKERMNKCFARCMHIS